MPAIEVTIDASLLAALISIPALVGYLFRSRQLKLRRKNVVLLERELLRTNAEILNLERKKTAMSVRLPEEVLQD